MKIIHFIYELVPGGAERFVTDLVNELAEDNIALLYTLRDDTEGDKGFYVPDLSKKVIYRNLKISRGFSPWLIFRFYRILRTEKPHVVHCHLNLVNYFFPLSVIFRGRIKFIYTVHNAAETEVNSLIEKYVMRFFFKHGFFTPVAISDETKISFRAFYGIDRIPLIYNGRKFSGRSREFEKAAAEVERFKKSVNTKVFSHVSRYDEKQKNHSMLVSVFNRLRAEGCDAILLVIGNGFENAVELKELAGDNIHFLGIRSNVSDYLYISDGLCLSSNFEGMPISLIEAFACGCPAVCTPVGGMVNVVKNGINGFLSNTVSESDYYDAVMQLITNGDEIDKNGLIEYYENNFGIEECKDRYLNLYLKSER
ncbi:MAG: glycosyltransferase [Bacteroidales bacterium]